MCVRFDSAVKVKIIKLNDFSENLNYITPCSMRYVS